MYYPVQAPFVLHTDFTKNILYNEYIAQPLSGFVICFWDMQPRSPSNNLVKNIIVTDGCIDLVADFNTRKIGFSGMSTTVFDNTIDIQSLYLGARLMPGAFYQLTHISAKCAMDHFLPLSETAMAIDENKLFSLPLYQAKKYFRDCMQGFIGNKSPDRFTLLFNELYRQQPKHTATLYQMTGYSPRQCQRVFAQRFGLTPKMVLSIIRFQKCLEILTAPGADPSHVLETVNYYDQPHYIKDFKQNIGITPVEFIQKYRK